MSYWYHSGSPAKPSPKKRPAVIVSNRTYSTAKPDVVVIPITSQLRSFFGVEEVSVGQWQTAGLLKPSTIKPVFATLEQRLIIRQLGILDAADQTADHNPIPRL
jgi:mRNA interferase MazF